MQRHRTIETEYEMAIEMTNGAETVVVTKREPTVQFYEATITMVNWEEDGLLRQVHGGVHAVVITEREVDDA
jgi:hypothetical protein